ncbi:Uncharacterized protein TCAP_02735 [Tolypocladium capitatum]|uniref:Uncharacterized protein n=1 Tax=Tolypocladium capitatum TaxID=45235 RepID=A0A2K3QII0_9HYPO|nr:Uncharacterized protein TCAP_02735 [Tolypocladium capitatum]
MLPSPPPAPSLPVAAEHAILSNRISLLFAKQSSLRATLNRASAERPHATALRQRATDDDDDDDCGGGGGGANPHAGPGYTSTDKETAQGATDRMLRGRLLGKRRADGSAARARPGAESESEEDEGRSALGKRKRPRRQRHVGVQVLEEAEADSGGRGGEALERGDAEHDQGKDSEATRITTEEETQIQSRVNELQQGAARKRKNKKKRKKQQGGAAKE